MARERIACLIVSDLELDQRWQTLVKEWIINDTFIRKKKVGHRLNEEIGANHKRRANKNHHPLLFYCTPNN